jgi:formylglycine-generating enzyme required for sulfatase activity
MTPMPSRLAYATAGLLMWSGVATAAALQPGDRFSDCADCPELVVVPAGEFAMGSPQDEAGHQETEGPLHKVEIRRPIAIGLSEVSADEWQACVNDNACVVPAGDDAPGLPVAGISWNDAKDYTAWLTAKSGESYRLPSEAEWEYAARAGTATPWFWGEAADMSCTFANLANAACNDGHDGPAPRGDTRTNPFGLHDMAGNLSEWVEDCWYEGYGGAPEDGNARTLSLRTSLPEPYAPYPPGNCNWKVHRGGSWASPPVAARSAARSGLPRYESRDTIGLRVVRSLP